MRIMNIKHLYVCVWMYFQNEISNYGRTHTFYFLLWLFIAIISNINKVRTECKYYNNNENNSQCERKYAHVLGDTKNCRINFTVSSCQPSAAERRNVLKETVKIIETQKRILAEKLCVRSRQRERERVR